MKVSEHLNRAQDFINISLSKRGWCPYAFSAGEEPSTEATAWSAIALSGKSFSATGDAIDFLINSQNRDGGWSTGPGLGKSDWTSGPATLALRLVPRLQPSINQSKNLKTALANACHYLLASRVDFLPPVARLLLLFAQGPDSLHYGRGWPWTKDCYNWVEPTAYSLMALKIPEVVDDQLTKMAVFHANKFLVEHACKGGGWNHGAYLCLGQYYAPYVTTTAEALLSLIDVPNNEKVQLALSYLKGCGREHHSVMSLSWTVLALHAYGNEIAEHIHWLLNLQNEDGSFGSNYFVTALAALALNAAQDINPFKIRMR